jgi:hypothetical protein
VVIIFPQKITAELAAGNMNNKLFTLPVPISANIGPRLVISFTFWPISPYRRIRVLYHDLHA